MLGGIALIVLLTTRLKVHPFFALVGVSFLVGFGAGLSATEILTVMKEGFGHIMRSLGFLIVLGTTLGIILERSGSTSVLAAFILKKVGAKRSALAMSITGLIVGLPIFCDSGFIVLSGLNASMAKRSGMKVIILAVSLATGLYSVHCLIPPHPGASAAAALIEVDFGRLIFYGVIVAIPAMLIGYWWSSYAGSKMESTAPDDVVTADEPRHLPSVIQSALPLFVPILLIALKSFFPTGTGDSNIFAVMLSFIGDPVVALGIGILLCLLNTSLWKSNQVNVMLKDAIEKSGSILVIIGSGGAFGAVLAATKIGQHFSTMLPLENLGLLFPFLITFILKTAQGSSTVAIITAASIVQPLLPALGLDYETGKLLSVLAMGSGSMMISHANDAYFWVISNFERLSMKAMLSVYSVATILMGLVSLAVIYLLSWLL